MTNEQHVHRSETDKRLLDGKFLRGQISEEQLAEYLETIPDASENAEEVVVVMEERRRI